jgi:DNA-binding PadR family transcriptional regulator
MSFAHHVLGLLEEGPQHGYELKQRYDDQLAPGRLLPFGQVYATLARLHRDGLADVAGVESGSGPDRKRYVITPEGVADLERWLDTPTEVGAVRSELFARVVIALLSGRDPDAVLDGQRAVHLTRMREVTDRRRGADLIDAMACDLELDHLEADVKWIEDASRRLKRERDAARKD